MQIRDDGGWKFAKDMVEQRKGLADQVKQVAGKGINVWLEILGLWMTNLLSIDLVGKTNWNGLDMLD